MSRFTIAFGALVVAQAAHSVEEYVGRLWENFPPAAFLTGLISSNGERGFIILNVAIVAFGLWCLIWPVRLGWRSANALAWGWVVIETINGVGHPAWTILRGRYTPGVGTAPLLLVLALYLASRLRHPQPRTMSAA
jgi:Protein of unknown function with HXXEE motif